jgi:hypothetical protein
VTPPPSGDPVDEEAAETVRDLMGEARRVLPPEVDVVTLGPGGRVAGATTATASDVADGRARVLALSRDVLGRLAAVATYRRPPRAAWSACDDLGGQVAYRVSGRVDAAAGSDEGFLDEVLRVVRDAGVVLTEVSDGADAVTWQGERDDVRVQLTGYAAQPLVLVSLTGPCLDVGDADEELLNEPPERLDVR